MKKFVFLHIFVSLFLLGCECYHDRTGCNRSLKEIFDDEFNGKN